MWFFLDLAALKNAQVFRWRSSVARSRKYVMFGPLEYRIRHRELIKHGNHQHGSRAGVSENLRTFSLISLSLYSPILRSRLSNFYGLLFVWCCTSKRKGAELSTRPRCKNLGHAHFCAVVYKMSPYELTQINVLKSTSFQGTATCSQSLNEARER